MHFFKHAYRQTVLRCEEPTLPNNGETEKKTIMSVKTLILKELCYRCEQKGTGFIADHHTQHDRLNVNTDAKDVH
jgi:hypothetical protein